MENEKLITCKGQNALELIGCSEKKALELIEYVLKTYKFTICCL